MKKKQEEEERMINVIILLNSKGRANLEAIQRLVRSLQRSIYPINHTINLLFHYIAGRPSKINNMDLLKWLLEFTWDHGSVKIQNWAHRRDRKQISEFFTWTDPVNKEPRNGRGIRKLRYSHRQRLGITMPKRKNKFWHEEVTWWQPETKYERAIFLDEDTMELSPLWYIWVQQMYKKYGNRSDIAGFTLQPQFQYWNHTSTTTTTTTRTPNGNSNNDDDVTTTTFSRKNNDKL